MAISFAPCRVTVGADVVQDWDKTSSPLSTSGKEPKFVKPPDKFSSTEGEHAFVILEITGDPIPKFEWFRVSEANQCKRRKF